MWGISPKLQEDLKDQIENLNNFDWKFYIKKYPDLLKNGIDTELKAKQHYIIHGIKEKRECISNKNKNKIFIKIDVKEEEILEIFHVVNSIINTYKNCEVEAILKNKEWDFLFKIFKNLVFLKDETELIEDDYLQTFSIVNLTKTPLNLIYLYKTKFNIKNLNLSRVEISEFIKNEPNLKKCIIKNNYVTFYINSNEDTDIQKKYISIIENLHLKYKLVLVGDMNYNLKEINSYLDSLILHKKIIDCRGLTKEESSYIINNSQLYIGSYSDFAALAQILNIPSFIIYDGDFNPCSKIYRYHNSACEILNLNTSESILKFVTSGFKYNWTNLLTILNDITYQNLFALKNT